MSSSHTVSDLPAGSGHTGASGSSGSAASRGSARFQAAQLGPRKRESAQQAASLQRSSSRAGGVPGKAGPGRTSTALTPAGSSVADLPAPKAPAVPASSGSGGSGHTGHSSSGHSGGTRPAAAQVRTATRNSRPRQTRKARLRVARVDPWSVTKTSLLFGVAGGIMLVVATFIVFAVLGATGLWGAINNVVSEIFTSPTATSDFDITNYINTRRATAFAALLAAIDVIIITALCTVFAFLYNLAANVMGGIEITLAED